MSTAAVWPSTTQLIRAPRRTFRLRPPVRLWVALHERLMGRETILLSHELRSWESRPAADIESRRLAALRDLVHHARIHCPHYWDTGLPDAGSIECLQDLETFPFLSRETVREHHPRMIWANAPRRLLLGHTHGTFDEPVRFHWDRARQAWDKANRLRGHAWHGFDIGDRELHLWPLDPPCTVGGRMKQHLREIRDGITAELQIDSLALIDGRISPNDALAQWREFDPARITAYPSMLVELIRAGLECGGPIGNPGLQAVFLTGEVTLDWQRRLIESTLGVPTIQCYGLQEVGAIAFACERGHWHVSAESAIVEIIRNGRPAAPGELGEIVVTGLQSHAMPMIRYRTGDLAVAEESSQCPCGRTLPTMPPILGRIGDFLETTDGRRLMPREVINALSEVLMPGTFQVDQDDRGDISVSAIEYEDLPVNWQNRVIQRARELIGRFRICTVNTVPTLRRTAFGKCRYVTSQRNPTVAG